MNPIQKWQNGMPLNENDKLVIRRSGYNPDQPYGQTNPATTDQINQTPRDPNNIFAPGAVSLLKYGNDQKKQEEDAWAAAIKQWQDSQSSSASDPNRYKIIGNQKFDLDNPQGRLDYYNAVRENLLTQRADAESKAQEAYGKNKTSAVKQYTESLATLDQNLKDIESEAKRYVDEYLGTVKGFNEAKGVGDVNRQGYFAQISPNAFQSSQASSQGYADTKYQEGVADLAKQAQNTVGLDYLNNPTGYGAFNPDSAYGRQAAQVGKQRTDVENAYNTYGQEQSQALADNYSQIGNSFNQGLASNAESLGQIDLQKGGKPFQYGVQTTTPYKAKAADISGYTPYTNFNSLAPGSTAMNFKSPAGSNAFTQQGADSYLGRTKTTLPGSSQDWFNKYLMGKATA